MKNGDPYAGIFYLMGIVVGTVIITLLKNGLLA